MTAGTRALPMMISSCRTNASLASFSGSKGKILENINRPKKTSEKKNVSIEFMYPFTGWMILSLTPQLEQGSSNTSETYQKNLGSFKMILIF